MSALDRLKEKIEAWKARIAELEDENGLLRKQLEEKPQQAAAENDTLHEALEQCREQVTSLEKEMVEKDQEIEAIIAKVEALIE